MVEQNQRKISEVIKKIDIGKNSIKEFTKEQDECYICLLICMNPTKLSVYYLQIFICQF